MGGIMRRLVIPLLCVIALSGCRAASSQGGSFDFEEQLRKTLAEHPEIVLKALEENKVEVLAIVEQGARERELLKRESLWRTQAANPLKPLIPEERAIYGNRDAEITIVEYSDFLCPYCGRGKMTVKQLVKESGGNIRAIFKHVPLHDGSTPLSALFEAVSMQSSEKAWEYAEKVFERQALLGNADRDILNEILGELGVDAPKAWKDAESTMVKERLRQDEAEAEKFRITGTPTYLINGVMLRGALPKRYFEKVLDIIEEEVLCEDCLNK